MCRSLFVQYKYGTSTVRYKYIMDTLTGSHDMRFVSSVHFRSIQCVRWIHLLWWHVLYWYTFITGAIQVQVLVYTVLLLYSLYTSSYWSMICAVCTGQQICRYRYFFYCTVIQVPNIYLQWVAYISIINGTKTLRLMENSTRCMWKSQVYLLAYMFYFWYLKVLQYDDACPKTYK